jgi:hypothetical protein
MTRLVWLGLLAGGIVSTCGLIVGCGTSTYDTVLDRGVATLRTEGKFRGLFAPVQIPDAPFTVRIPVIFTDSYTPDSSHPDDGAKILPQRMQPPFMASQNNIKLMFEGKVKEGNETLPYYVYLGASPVKPGEVDKFADAIEKGVKTILPADQAPTWEAIDADTPMGKAIHWRKMRVTIDQPFFINVEGADKPEVKTMPGVLELWLHDAGEYAVVIVWRAPKQIEGPQQREFESSGGLTMAVPNAKPDLSKWPILTAGTLAPVEPAP